MTDYLTNVTDSSESTSSTFSNNGTANANNGTMTTNNGTMTTYRPPEELKDKDRHWTVQNTNTLLKWITIGSHYIKVLERNIAVNRKIIRFNTIQSIILTTATGSIGVSQISSIFSSQTQMILTLIFTAMSFFLTISTGVIKVLLIHENLEKCIQVKQEWTSFITNISTELQLPKVERQDAVKLIRDNKLVYLSLLNKDIEINHKSEDKARHHIQDEIEISKQELDADEVSKTLHKKGINNDIIELEFSKKKTLHNNYSKLMNSVGISISDITNHIVKTELQAIVELDLEAQREQINIKSAQMEKVKLNCEFKYRQKEIEQKKSQRPTDFSRSGSTDLALLTDSGTTEKKNSFILESYSNYPESPRQKSTRPTTSSDKMEEEVDTVNSESEETGSIWKNLFSV
jgi:hypothetical protein